MEEPFSQDDLSKCLPLQCGVNAFMSGARSLILSEVITKGWRETGGIGGIGNFGGESQSRCLVGHEAAVLLSYRAVSWRVPRASGKL